ncbi:MAG: hypothetical protein A2Z42_03665 [Candidatus Woykebacteria bacterium RBG_19FT_COMBO_43_10]|uniref:Uncharacterized protein n=1 Tax=Candidatus Woykebacteria bacterium RBG_19FT_COMBO_43_10 TaxID=1802598 RepID=A0A1G1WJU0_9BACT|nr:MAG: hypothetical protein A2Z42_03665 [Candidatus Woykebacteria bacterium RBG_19FT_COMBO_43_10]
MTSQIELSEAKDRLQHVETLRRELESGQTVSGEEVGDVVRKLASSMANLERRSANDLIFEMGRQIEALVVTAIKAAGGVPVA